MPKKIDLTNKHFSEWTVLREATKEEKGNKKGLFWICECSCGTIKMVSGMSLRNGDSKSCGCMTSKYIGENTQYYNNLKYNLVGQTFNRLTVVEKAKSVNGNAYWNCKCICGNYTTANTYELKNGKVKSCGCLRKEVSIENQKNSPHQKKDMINNRYGKLTVVDLAYIKNNTRYWKCKCDCGNEKILSTGSLTSGNTSSCGCMKISKGELYIREILDNNNIIYIPEFIVEIKNKKYRFDFAILNEDGTIKYFIEFDGLQHYIPVDWFGGEKQFKTTQENDLIKNKYCENNNIPLIRIPYSKLKTMTINDLILQN